MTSAAIQIDVYWSEIDTLRSSNKNYGPCLSKGVCQCSTDSVIKDSSDPVQMRSFMIIGVLIDQIMFKQFRELYPKFRSVFRYPNLLSHDIGGCGNNASPQWLTRNIPPSSWDNYMSSILLVAQIHLDDLCQWFCAEGKIDELSSFKNLLKAMNAGVYFGDQEVGLYFQLDNKGWLIPTIGPTRYPCSSW